MEYLEQPCTVAQSCRFELAKHPAIYIPRGLSSPDVCRCGAVLALRRNGDPGSRRIARNSAYIVRNRRIGSHIDGAARYSAGRFIQSRAAWNTVLSLAW